MVRTAKQIKEKPAAVESDACSCGVVEPIASFGAMGNLMSVVPDGTVTNDLPLFPTRSSGLRRFRRALITGLPLLMADVVAIFGIQVGLGTVVNSDIAVWAFVNADVVSFFCASYVLFAHLLGLYPGTGVNAVVVLRLQTHAVFYATVLSAVAAYATIWLTIDSLAVFIFGAIVCGLLLPTIRSLVRRKFSCYQWWGERAVIVGTNGNSLAICEFLQTNAHLGLRSIGVVDDDAADYWETSRSHQIPFLGLTDELLDICRVRDAHWVVVTVGGRNRSDIDRVLAISSLVPNLIVANDSLALPSLWCHSFDAAGVAGFKINDRLLQPMVRVAKRLIDIVLSGSLLILACPVFAALAVCVKMASPGPILFGHERIGRGGRKFKALKFRTMVLKADEVLDQYLAQNLSARDEWIRNHKLLNDPRIIAVVGNLLRRCSLDELPQLWNVLCGDMSLVGPRPIVASEVCKYGNVFPLYVRVRPGLTGLWQVSGRNQTSYESRVQLDSYYVRSWSLWLDYYILLRTVKTVLTRQGSC